ncbi:hypothetical protein BDW59DRAFT_157155 [Aspergillus cavernicola]|uniref:Uncharacterized protein n=1 Tax=Aspergillus cavernicola TaxID=176166 RepID=A0ABR4IZ19_9EURO
MSDSFDRSRLIGVGSLDDNAAAVRGERVPHIVSGRATLCCVVRGIRYHDGFASDLRGIPELPELTRALNARAIMSNRIPKMHTPQEFPYCFWHPDVPCEETLRELLTRYPDNALLPYQVGRACAVGGYTELYRHLDILPDVSIAEEARDNRESGTADLPGRHGSSHSLPEVVFDITEDQCIDVEGILPGDRPVSPETVQLLHSPLPADLPTVDKDLLILMAAWTGKIDRYARLRRPRMVDGELPCVVRGIYHHPFFAKWWLTQPDKGLGILIRQAVHARCTMNNDLSWLSDTTPETELPEMIWFPQPARPETYIELARRQPRMASRAARACMHANYQEAFNKVSWEPDKWLWVEAQHLPNTHYLARIERKAAAMGIDCEQRFLPELGEAVSWEDRWPTAVLGQEWPHHHPNGSQSLTLVPELTTNHVGFQHPEETTTHSTVGQVLLHACVADESIRPTPAEGELDLGEIYQGDLAVQSEKDGRITALYRGSGRGRRRGGRPHH